MLTRRILLTSTSACAALLGLAGWPGTGRAQTPEQATAFIQQAGQELVGVINGGAPAAERQVRLKEIVDRIVDVDGIARFCLGRYWRSATPAQRQQYLALFHQVLQRNIASKLGDYKGVTFVVGRAAPREGAIGVATVVTRPGTAPANVEWLVSSATGSPKIVDMIAEGTSLRLTQRSDYASYIERNGSSVAALLDAMRRQLAQPS